MATQSLYRRYRPRRFSELKGQDHVVKALRDAVAQGREGQAYLFSGPRGTGKTTSARILAKVLNCENVADGEPCCACESCLAVERGISYDVHELDAASNNGVDAIRDLVEKSALGTPGRHKVYILDEVHMLSKAAEAALLKTLEEPPPHVVFVLATTDPQKMSDTIRSRTQHLQFHLLPSETMAEHVKWVAEDAGLNLSQAALDAALVQGGGSARDTLSALELLSSTGGDVSDVIDLDEFLAALADRDSGRVLTAMGHAVSLGRDPRTVTEQIVRHVRNAFLSLMAPELVMLPPDRVDAIAVRAQQIGAAMLVRAIERLGATLVEMRHAPDPRILAEVALVQLTNDDAGTDVEALLARIERLETTVKQLRESGATGLSAAAAQAPKDPTTGRAVLGGAARKPTAATPPAPAASDTAAVSTPAPPSPAASSAVPAQAERSEPAPEPVRSAAPASSSSGAVWDTVRTQLKGMARARYANVHVVAANEGSWQLGVANEATRAKCAENQKDVEAALTAAIGSPITISFVVSAQTDADEPAPAPIKRQPPASAPPTPAPAAPAADAAPTQPAAVDARPVDDEVVSPNVVLDVPPPDDEIDLSELTDAPPESVKTPIDRLAEAFPGSEFVNES